MKLHKSSLIMIFLLSSCHIVFSQNDISTNKKLAKKSCDSFFNSIINEDNYEAYEQLSLEAKHKEPKNDFELKIKKMFQYYGSLNSFNYEKERGLIFTNESALVYYTVNFQKITLETILSLVKDSTSYKIDFYHFKDKSKTLITEFNEITEKPLELLLNKDYKKLYNLDKYKISTSYEDLLYDKTTIDILNNKDSLNNKTVRDLLLTQINKTKYTLEKHHFQMTYKDFLNEINKLIKTEYIKHELISHEINVLNGIVIYRFDYNINNEGNIIFEYVEENNLPLLHDINFEIKEKI